MKRRTASIAAIEREPYPVIMMGDFMKDLDDEHCLIGAAGLIRQNKISLLCVVANLAPTMLRARGAKGTLNQLGLMDIPVVRGSSMVRPDMPAAVVHDYESQVPYLADETEIEGWWVQTEEDVKAESLLLLTRLLRASEDGSVILVLNSGLTDALNLMQNDQSLFVSKIKHVAIMGGVEWRDDEDDNDNDNDEEGKDNMEFAVANNAANNMFDMPAAQKLYRLLQELDVPMVVTMRDLAYAVQVPFKLYDALEESRNAVGKCLKNRQQPALQQLWVSACSAAGSEARGSLPVDRTRQWFVAVFCDGTDPAIADGDEIWPYVSGFNLYDPANLYAAIPELQDRFFDAHTFGSRGQHKVIGLSKDNHGVKDPERLSQFMVDTAMAGLARRGGGGGGRVGRPQQREREQPRSARCDLM